MKMEEDSPPMRAALPSALWPRDLEMELFDVMCGHKPVGVSRHFRMIAIYRHLRNHQANLTSNDVWEHLNALYDMDTLEEGYGNDPGNPFELPPFVSKGKKFEEFSLPTSENYFATRMAKLGQESSGRTRRSAPASDKTSKNEPETRSSAAKLKRTGTRTTKRKRGT
eukprot:m.37085 g.37085  ORF g.37085 m.37085 type:complete len:167 (-) comp9241_c0_seq1:27-527(-)